MRVPDIRYTPIFLVLLATSTGLIYGQQDQAPSEPAVVIPQSIPPRPPSPRIAPPVSHDQDQPAQAPNPATPVDTTSGTQPAPAASSTAAASASTVASGAAKSVPPDTKPALPAVCACLLQQPKSSPAQSARKSAAQQAIESSLKTQIAREWKQYPKFCLEAVHQLGQNHEPDALKSIERGQSQKTRQLYENAFTYYRDSLWQSLLGASAISANDPSGLIDKQFKSDPASIHNAAGILGSVDNVEALVLVREMRRLLLAIADGDTSWTDALHDLIAKVQSIPVEDTGPGVNEAECLARILAGMTLDDRGVNTGIGIADVAKMRIVAQSVATLQWDAAALDEIFDPQRGKSGVLETYRANYSQDRVAFLYRFIAKVTQP